MRRVAVVGMLQEVEAGLGRWLHGRGWVGGGTGGSVGGGTDGRRGVIGDTDAGRAGGRGIRVSVMMVAAAPVVVEGDIFEASAVEGTVTGERRTGEGGGE